MAQNSPDVFRIKTGVVVDVVDVDDIELAHSCDGSRGRVTQNPSQG